MTTIIGRGHSGTRAIAGTLRESGVFMGDVISPASYDTMPYRPMYKAVRMVPPSVSFLGRWRWDFSKLRSNRICKRYRRYLKRFLKSIHGSTRPNKGWKLPETVLGFPWLVRLFPDIRYVFWIRDPRDCILVRHETDKLRYFRIPGERPEDERLRRVVSWKYQYQIYKSTLPPKHLLEVRFEDFVLDQDRTLKRLEKFLGISLVKIPVKPEAVGRWKTAEDKSGFDMFDEELREYGYEIPEGGYGNGSG